MKLYANFKNINYVVLNTNNIKQSIFLFTILIFISFSSNSQTRLPGSTPNLNSNEGNPINFNIEKQLKKDIDIAGLKVANKLMNCCSLYGGKDVYAIIDYDEVRKDPKTENFTIPMKVGWYGTITRNHFFIKGKLTVYFDGRKDWVKIRDSGGFRTGCSTGCIR